MTESKTKQFLERCEEQIWNLLKPVGAMNQMYQRQPFGRMTSEAAVVLQKNAMRK
jgi:hypothetical protein